MNGALNRAATTARRAFAALVAWAIAVCCLPSTPAIADETQTNEEDLVKIETPTVTKTVWDGTSYTHAADAAAGELVWYQVTGTLPSNLSEFAYYAYEFHDYLDEALIVDLSSISVEIVRGGEAIEDVTELFEITLERNDGSWELVVAAEDLLLAASDITETDTVLLSYAVEIDADTAQSGTEMGNYVYVRYTSKPFTDAFGRSVEASASLYTWQLSLLKVDAETFVELSGAKFTIQNEDGLWVCADGALSSEKVVLETDDLGMLYVATLDAGVYTITEVEAPSGYSVADAFELVVSADLSGSSPTLSAAANSGAVEVSVDAESGTVFLVVDDEESIVTSFFVKTGDAFMRVWPLLATTAVVAGCGALVALAARRKVARRANG